MVNILVSFIVILVCNHNKGKYFSIHPQVIYGKLFVFLHDF